MPGPTPRVGVWALGSSAGCAQPDQPATPALLQALLDRFLDQYNHHRPHRSLPHKAAPAALYDTLPKALPAASRDLDTHDRVRHDRIDSSGVVTLRVGGRLHHIGIGRTYARTHILLLVHDLDVHVVDAVTGELLRELRIDPERDYQPTGRPRGPAIKRQDPNPNEGSGYADVLRHHRVPRVGFEPTLNGV